MNNKSKRKTLLEELLGSNGKLDTYKRASNKSSSQHQKGAVSKLRNETKQMQIPYPTVAEPQASSNSLGTQERFPISRSMQNAGIHPGPAAGAGSFTATTARMLGSSTTSMDPISTTVLLRENQNLRQRLAEQANSYRRRIDTYKQAQQSQASLVSRLQTKIQQFKQRCSDLEDRMHETIKPTPLATSSMCAALSPTKIATGPPSSQVVFSDSLTLDKTRLPCSSSLDKDSPPPTCGRDFVVYEDSGELCSELEEEEHNKFENLLTQNNALRQQLEASNRTNEALINDLQKITNDWSSLRDELLIKEDEYKEEGQSKRVNSIMDSSLDECHSANNETFDHTTIPLNNSSQKSVVAAPAAAQTSPPTSTSRLRAWIYRRKLLGASNNLIKELKLGSPKDFENFLRMNSDQFDYLEKNVEAILKKRNKRSIPLKIKLEITLRYLATGDSMQSLQFLFRVPSSTISEFLPEMLAAIARALSPFIEVPNTVEKWSEIQKKFVEVWQFPGCVGVIDGKHINIVKPPGSGDEFLNYKHFYSIVLFAIVDAEYNFLYFDIGKNGSVIDSAIFTERFLNIALESDTLGLPKNAVLIGDKAFPLKTNLLKPYSGNKLSDEQTTFNNRLTRARVVVKNAFGRLASKFRVFSRPIDLKLDTVDQVVLAACSLHNWLQKTTPDKHPKPKQVNNSSPDILLSISSHVCNNKSECSAEEVRQAYAKYFAKGHPLPWQC